MFIIYIVCFKYRASHVKKIDSLWHESFKEGLVSVITTDCDRINTQADEREIIKNDIEWREKQKTDMEKIVFSEAGFKSE